METAKNDRYKNIGDAVTAIRRQLLDVVELAFGDSPKWPVVRNRILNIMGESGIEGFIDLQVRGDGKKRIEP